MQFFISSTIIITTIWRDVLHFFSLPFSLSLSSSQQGFNKLFRYILSDGWHHGGADGDDIQHVQSNFRQVSAFLFPLLLMYFISTELFNKKYANEHRVQRWLCQFHERKLQIPSAAYSLDLSHTVWNWLNSLAYMPNTVTSLSIVRRKNFAFCQTVKVKINYDTHTQYGCRANAGTGIAESLTVLPFFKLNNGAFSYYVLCEPYNRVHLVWVLLRPLHTTTPRVRVCDHSRTFCLINDEHANSESPFSTPLTITQMTAHPIQAPLQHFNIKIVSRSAHTFIRSLTRTQPHTPTSYHIYKVLGVYLSHF